MLPTMKDIMIDFPAAGPRPVPDAKDWTTVLGAARILGCARSTVYDLIGRGALTPHDMFGVDVALLLVSEVLEIHRARERVAGRG